MLISAKHLPFGRPLTATEEDVKLLQAVVDRKLGPEVSAAQTRLLSTNKVEAFHLRTLKVLPKSKTYRGSFEGRVHSAVHNGSVGQVNSYIAATEKMKTNCNMSQKSKKILHFLAKRIHYHAQVQRSASSKYRRYARKQRKIDLKKFSRKKNNLVSIIKPIKH